MTDKTLIEQAREFAVVHDQYVWFTDTLIRTDELVKMMADFAARRVAEAVAAEREKWTTFLSTATSIEGWIGALNYEMRGMANGQWRFWGEEGYYDSPLDAYKSLVDVQESSVIDAQQPSPDTRET